MIKTGKKAWDVDWEISRHQEMAPFGNTRGLYISHAVLVDQRCSTGGLPHLLYLAMQVDT